MSSPTITFIGAGSSVFARALLRDIYTFPELRDATIALMDIDPERLTDSEVIAHREHNRAGATGEIIATTDRGQALDGASYVINMIQVGGYKPATVIDFEIPKRYGLRQTIGDTLGIGGIMRGLRTIPVLLDIAADMEKHCPGALLLQYSNPMAILMWSLFQGASVASVGLCHSVQGTAHSIANWLDIPAAELDYLCAGINHMAYYQRLERDGVDVYPDLTSLGESGQYPAWERVRFDVLKNFGYFGTESSEHFSEYVPWYISAKRPELIERYNIPLDEYPFRCEEQIADWVAMRTAIHASDPGALAAYEQGNHHRLDGMDERRLAVQERADPQRAAEYRANWLSGDSEEASGHSGEYGSLIIHSMETGIPRVIYGNVLNSGSISNLPPDCCVEVPCLVDANGVQPTVVGDLPPQLVSLMQTNINVQRMTVEAALTGRRDHVYQAALLDPHTAAELDPEQIRQMVDELIAAHGDWLPEYR